MLDQKQVKHVAKLARISLNDEEVERFTSQLSKVLDYMDILNELTTDKIEQTSQVTGLTNVMEADEILPSSSSREELLNCSELPVESKQIRVLPAIK